MTIQELETARDAAWTRYAQLCTDARTLPTYRERRAAARQIPAAEAAFDAAWTAEFDAKWSAGTHPHQQPSV